MRKGSLLATFTRKKRSTKEDTSPTWHQNESLPEEFQSLQDHYQQQQQTSRQGHMFGQTKMPRLPGSHSNTGRNRPQMSAPRSRADSTPSLVRLPSLQVQHAQPDFSHPAQYQQAHLRQDAGHELDQWPHLNAVPEPMPGVWPTLDQGLRVPDPGAGQQFNHLQQFPPSATPLQAHTNPLMDSYIQPDEYAGGTYEGWPASYNHQPHQDADHDSTSQQPLPDQMSGRVDANQGRALFGQQDRLDPWTGLLESAQQHPVASPLRTARSGINWGLDRDSLSLAASASKHAASSRGASQRTSQAASQLQGSLQRSARPHHMASHKRSSGEQFLSESLLFVRDHIVDALFLIGILLCLTNWGEPAQLGLHTWS